MARQLVYRLKILLLALLLIIGFCILVLGIVWWNIDYSDFARTVLNAVGKQDWRAYFETSVFPPRRFEFVQYFLPFLFLFWAGICFLFYRKGETISEQIIAFFAYSIQALKQEFQVTKGQEIFWLCLILSVFALRGLWQIYAYELQYDEAWTYNHFVSKGMLISAISPNNNHILYTLFACLTDYLPLEAKYSLRLPVYLGGLVTSWLFYVFARSFWGKNWALVALAWFCFSPAICFYSMYARGYIFQMLFSILGIWASLKLLASSERKTYYWSLWVFANVLGLYSVPTHAYVFLGLSGILFFVMIMSKNLDWKTWLKANLAIFVVAGLLYFPFIITNGLTILLDANIDSTQGQILFFNYQDNVSDWLLTGGGRGTRVYWFLMSILFVLGGLAYKNREEPKRQRPIFFVGIFLLMPTLFNLILGSQPPFRVWCFLTIFCGMTIAIIGSELFGSEGKSPTLIVLALSLTLFSIQRTEVHYAIRWSAEMDQEAKKIAHLMLDEKIKTCYFFANYDKPLFEFYYLRKGARLNTYMAYPTSKNYQPFVDRPLYESVCWDNEDGKPSSAQTQWLEAYYPTIMYKNNRIEIRLPKS